MRKQVFDKAPHTTSSVDQEWLDLQTIAQVELTSEDAAHPIEAALLRGSDPGWRAASAGEQTIRILFHESRSLKRVQLLFFEDQRPRTQEFVLRWLPNGDRRYRDIVRQQYNFSPPAVTRESEDYKVDLAEVRALELSIVPDISGGDTRASLAQLRLE